MKKQIFEMQDNLPAKESLDLENAFANRNGWCLFCCAGAATVASMAACAIAMNWSGGE